MTLRFLILAAWLTLSSPVWASVTTDIAAIDARLTACTARDSSTAGLINCNDDAYTEAKKLLTQIYRRAENGIKNAGPGDDPANSKETLKRLIASERAWIAYRDAECSLQGTEMLGGSGEGVIVTGCLFSMTKERAKSLDELFNGSAAIANDLEVPILEHGNEDGDSATCGSMTVTGLNADGDGFLAVRNGPGSQYRKIDELHNGEIVYDFDSNGPWVGIVYRTEKVECQSPETHPVIYEKKGWVHKKWLERLAE